MINDMYCINCGKELPENARFCLYCGAKVNIGEKKQDSAEEVLTNYFVNTIPFIYDDLVECTDYPYIYGYINGEVGLLDAKDASMVVPCQYDKIIPYFYTESKQFAYSEVQRNGKWGFFENRKEIISCIYDSVNLKVYNNTSIYIITVGDNKGLINRNTWKKTECIYDEINFEEDGILVSIANKHGIFDKECKEILPCLFEKYDKIIYDKNTYKVYNNKKCGIWDIRESNYVVPCCYDDVCYDAYGAYTGTYWIKNNNKYGLYTNEESIKPIYDNIKKIDGYLKLYIGQKVGLASLQGKIMFQAKYDSIEELMCNFTHVTKGAIYSYDEYLVSIGYIVQENNKVLFIDKNGKEFRSLSNLNFNSVKLIFSNKNRTYYKVCRDGKYGMYYFEDYENDTNYYPPTGFPCIPCKYNSLEDIVVACDNKKNNIRYYIYSLNGKYGILNKEFKEYAPCKYDEIKDVKSRLGTVVKRTELYNELIANVI